MDDETKRIIGHLMGIPAGMKITVMQHGCEKQKGLDCGLHVIAMAIAFVLGLDPADAKFSHLRLRETLRTIFECQRIQMFPVPEKGEVAVMTKGK